MNAPLLARCRERIAGVLTRYERILINGTLPGECHAVGMTSFLIAQHIRNFDYPRLAEPLRDRIWANTEKLAESGGAKIEYLAKAYIRKEDVVATVIKTRGNHPGLVLVLSAMEACSVYKPWHDQRTGQTCLRPTAGKCLQYYYYFINAELILVYLRLPTWYPFRLQFYCNGQSWLARQLTATGIDYPIADNAFIRIDDWVRAQVLADSLSPDVLHRILDHYATACCPVLDVFGLTGIPRFRYANGSCSSRFSFKPQADHVEKRIFGFR